MTKAGMRKFWFQIHKWIGITLVVVIIPLALSGAALVWGEPLDGALNPERDVSGEGKAVLAPSAYLAAAAPRIPPGMEISSMRFEEEHALKVIATRMKAPAASNLPLERLNIWIDPADGHVLDSAPSNSGFVRLMENLHGNLFIPGYGRPLVGVLGIAMLISSLSGLWLWWPTSGRVTKGLRWRRASDIFTNLHHLAGFWIFLPLAMLSATGIWIAFPEIAATLSGTKAPSLSERMVRMRALPIAETRLGVDDAVARARAAAPGTLVSVGWPTNLDASWKIGLKTTGNPAEVSVDDATGEARTGGGPGGIGRFIRRLHDGIGMGTVWQAMIFLGGIMPALLGITGLVMWWRSRGWRADVARRKKAA